jgi:hypothetical protein
VKKTFNLNLTFLFLTGILMLGACATPVDNNPATLSPPTVISSQDGAEDTPVPTDTIVWFPPTVTATPFSTPLASPSIDMRPGLGAQSLADDFSDPLAWQAAKAESDGGNNIIINRNRLTAAINVSPAYISSLHNGLLLKDFYAEVTVGLNRCAPSDSYGMLFRAAGNADAYRYTLGCNGQVRVERMQANKIIPIQNWLPSGDAPLAAPGEVTLGVWVAGVELRFFLNGHYQFKVIDPVFHNGTLGLFANSVNPNGMNVSFSNLSVRDISYVSPTPTATPRKTATPTRTPRP